MSKIQWVLTSFTSLSSKISPFDNSVSSAKEEELWEIIEQARLEWKRAEEFFNWVEDPELVDHAVYALGAAEKKYTYLLKKARKAGHKKNL
ncbi:MAG: DUF2508 family protein [Candidatus Syntrophonatronum acetioxidans]|uniref:DUF2508 family protein n=1 Tax=Candidatus Syntrophonatronum acetioxidans TaxID=1795816 RepID=A0A424Y9W9_9FIRM|nr:MAG: DUF2508 family protein [Candidatus Syntrophonatronum acetioxidans]